MFFKKKCPKCESTDLKTISEPLFTSVMRNLWNVIFPVRLLFSGNYKPKDKVVCRNCGYTCDKEML